MADFTQSLTALIVSRMNPGREYTESEQQVFMYGTELILNSLLKVTAYLAIGFLLGKGREIAVSLFLFGSLRKLSGGKHARTNLGCFLATGSILALSVGMPYIFCLPKRQYLWAAMAIWAVYARFAPCDQYYREAERKEEARRQKIKTLAVLTVVLLTGYMLSSYWKMLVLWISLLQGITLAEGGDCMTER